MNEHTIIVNTIPLKYNFRMCFQIVFGTNNMGFPERAMTSEKNK